MTKEFNRHDNIDYDVVEISKDSLLLKLRDCEKYASLPAETVGYGGIALTLYAAVFFTETTRGLWVVSGETIQASFLVGAVVATGVTITKGFNWYKARDSYTPESIVKSFSEVKIDKPIRYLPAPSQSSDVPTIRANKRRQKSLTKSN